MLVNPGESHFFTKRAVKRIRLTCLDYSRVEVAVDAIKQKRQGKQEKQKKQELQEIQYNLKF